MYKELPNSVKELHDFCNERKSPNWIDSKGKFIWIGDEAIMNFGSHKGKSLFYVAKKESGFLNWMLTKDFTDDVKKIASDALNGKFPIKQN